MTYVVERREVEGRMKVNYGYLQFGSGDVDATVIPANVGLTSIQELKVDPVGGYVTGLVKTSNASWALVAYEEEATAAGGPLLPSNDNMSALKFRFVARGW